jgi:hypothetical protein
MTVLIRDGEWNKLDEGERIERRQSIQTKIRARLS